MKKDVIQSRNRKHSRKPKAMNFANIQHDSEKQHATKTGAPEAFLFQSTTLQKVPYNNDSATNVSHSSYLQFTQTPTHAHSNGSVVTQQRPFISFCAPYQWSKTFGDIQGCRLTVTKDTGINLHVLFRIKLLSIKSVGANSHSVNLKYIILYNLFCDFHLVA